ncbi:MAG: Mrp/NBP35 family ATP-binding protein [Brevinematales bacterium]|nr:Mrp/NBP35 family ATP-binding protein [Brevinematales bacterium]
MTEKEVLDTLSRVMDPELGRNIVELGMVKNLKVDGEKVDFDLELTTAGCPLKDVMKKNAEAVLLKLGASEIEVRLTSRSIAAQTAPNSFISPDAFDEIRGIIPVYSSKGGVGKSTVAVNLAAALAKRGVKTALLDLDIYGPSIPRMLGISGTPSVFGNKLVPPVKYGIQVMSMGFLAGDADRPLIWRAPLANSAVKQLFEDTAWSDVDYLVVDLPPGTGDIPLTFAQNIPTSGALFVTTPQSVALDETRRSVSMFRQLDIPILGMVLNMADFVCPHCGKPSPLYPESPELKALESSGVPILARLPLDPSVAIGGDNGAPAVIGDPDGEAAKQYTSLAERIQSQICRTAQ